MQAIQERERESAVGLGICSSLPSCCCSLLLLLKASSGFLSSTAHEMEGSLWKIQFPKDMAWLVLKMLLLLRLLLLL
jgi:hypothetical protein